jgi:hypothetical protein
VEGIVVSLKQKLQSWNSRNDSSTQRYTPVGSLFFVGEAIAIGVAVGLLSASSGRHTSTATDQRIGAACLIAAAALLAVMLFLVERWLRDGQPRNR